MTISLKADPGGTFGEILVNGQVVAKLPATGNAVIPGLVGTVSQSGGVPTGAIIERGSNANGEYVRFADGTQICTVSEEVTDQAIDTAYGALFQGVRVWTYPASFVTTDSVSCGVGRWGSSASWSGISSTPSTTSVTLRFWDNVSRATGTTFRFQATAIGRWF